MSLFTIPASFANQLEKIMGDFLWSTNENGNGLHWVNWDEVRRRKQEGWLKSYSCYERCFEGQVALKVCRGGCYMEKM